MRTALFVWLLLVASGSMPARAAQPSAAAFADAGAATEALLASMGGRAAWARAKGYRVEATHHLANELRPFRNEILLDFREPRLRVRSDRADGQRMYAIHLDAAGESTGWRLVDGKPAPMSDAERVEERDWWNGNVYRTISRLARHDSALSVELAADGRLRVLEAGRPLIWYRLNRVGAPIAFAAGDGGEEAATIFGPLTNYGPLKFPSFSVRDGGRWRAIIERFEVDPALDDAQFRAPAHVP